MRHSPRTNTASSPCTHTSLPTWYHRNQFSTKIPTTTPARTRTNTIEQVIANQSQNTYRQQETASTHRPLRRRQLTNMQGQATIIPSDTNTIPNAHTTTDNHTNTHTCNQNTNEHHINIHTLDNHTVNTNINTHTIDYTNNNNSHIDMINNKMNNMRNRCNHIREYNIWECIKQYCTNRKGVVGTINNNTRQ